jgi:3-hydroxyisobutyrate dehydrogenase-like beta-hydroxyacid dehydrogenase
MARNLARAGLLVGVYNRTREPCDELARELEVTSCVTPSALAAVSDVLITMVADETASTDLYIGKHGFLETIRPGSIALEMSTVSIDHVHRLAALLEPYGCMFLDVPVSGSVSMAADASLTLLLGGEAETCRRVEPVLQALGSTIFHLGPVGAGAAMKLAVNAIIYGLNEALSEGLVLAERTGITRERAYEVFASSAVAAPFVHYRREAFERPGDVPVALRLRLAEKDCDLILQLAAEVGQPMPQTELNLEVLRRAAEAGFGEDDVSAVAEYLRRDGARADDGRAKES